MQHNRCVFSDAFLTRELYIAFWIRPEDNNIITLYCYAYETAVHSTASVRTWLSYCKTGLVDCQLFVVITLQCDIFRINIRKRANDRKNKMYLIIYHYYNLGFVMNRTDYTYTRWIPLQKVKSCKHYARVLLTFFILFLFFLLEMRTRPSGVHYQTISLYRNTSRRGGGSVKNGVERKKQQEKNHNDFNKNSKQQKLPHTRDRVDVQCSITIQYVVLIKKEILRLILYLSVPVLYCSRYFVGTLLCIRTHTIVALQYNNNRLIIYWVAHNGRKMVIFGFLRYFRTVLTAR